MVGNPGLGSAADWSVWGGQIVEEDQSALRANLGWGTELSYHFLVQRKLEMAPKIGLTFGSPVMSISSLAVLRNSNGQLIPGEYVYGQCCGVGNTFGTELRYALLQIDRVHLAVRGEVAFLTDYAGTQGNQEQTTLGARVGAGAALNYSVYHELNLIAGADIISDTYFQPVVSLLPILIRGGIEFMLDESLAIFAISRFGPGFTIFGPGVVDLNATLGAGFSVDGFVGIAYRFGAKEDLRFGSSDHMRVPDQPSDVGITDSL